MLTRMEWFIDRFLSSSLGGLCDIPKPVLLYGKKLPYRLFQNGTEWVLIIQLTYLFAGESEGTIAVVEDLYKRYPYRNRTNCQKN